MVERLYVINELRVLKEYENKTEIICHDICDEKTKDKRFEEITKDILDYMETDSYENKEKEVNKNKVFIRRISNGLDYIEISMTEFNCLL